MSRMVFLSIVLVISNTVMAGAASTWVLWGIKKSEFRVTEAGKQGVWSYIDAFNEKNDCMALKVSLAKEHTDYQYECLPAEINPSEIAFY